MTAVSVASRSPDEAKAGMRHIAISGELGSGKSAVAGALATMLGAEVLSTGAIHRQIAASRGESALETNLAAETDDEIDRRIDGELVRRAAAADQLVLDSRMAWHFVPEALTVHLVVDPAVGAARMLGRSPTDVERYASLEQATAQAEDRHASEQRRFLDKYDVDIDRLRNYDLVVDTSEATIDEVASRVRGVLAAPPSEPPLLCLSPRRLLPTAPVPDPAATPPAGVLPVVAYHRPWFVVVEGHARVSAALRGGEHLLDAVLGERGHRPGARPRRGGGAGMGAGPRVPLRRTPRAPAAVRGRRPRNS